MTTTNHPPWASIWRAIRLFAFAIFTSALSLVMQPFSASATEHPTVLRIGDSEDQVFEIFVAEPTAPGVFKLNYPPAPLRLNVPSVRAADPGHLATAPPTMVLPGALDFGRAAVESSTVTPTFFLLTGKEVSGRFEGSAWGSSTNSASSPTTATMTLYTDAGA